MKKIVLVAFKLTCSVLLLTWLLQDMQWNVLLQSIQQLPLWGLGLMLFCYLIAQLLSCLRWQLIGQMLHIPCSFNRLLDLYFIGMFFNLFLPTGIGGDVVKSYSLGKIVNNQLNAAYSVLFDRLSGLLALIWLCGCAFYWVDIIDIAWAKISIITLIASSVLIILFAPKLTQLLAVYIPRLSTILSPLQLLYQQGRTLMVVFSLALGVQLIGVFIVLMSGYWLGLQISPAFYIVSWTLIILLTLLPFSINGIGIREAGFIYLFQTQGVSSEQAMILSLISFIIPAVASLFALYRFKKPMAFYKT